MHQFFTQPPGTLARGSSHQAQALPDGIQPSMLFLDLLLEINISSMSLEIVLADSSNLMNLAAAHIMRRVEPMQTKWVELANGTSGLCQNRADDKPSG